MKGKQKRKAGGEEERPPEPRWKQQKPARRRKARKNQTAAPKVAAAAARLGLRSKGDEGGRGGAGKPGPRSRLPVTRITWRRAALALLLVLLALGGWELNRDERFYVAQPEVVGNVRVPAEEIAAASGIQNMHILWLRPGAVAARVKSLDGIADASVHFRPLNHVTIEVREQAPLLVWKVGGQDIWISQNGERVPATGKPPELTLNDVAAAAAAASAAAPVAAAPKASGTAGQAAATTAVTATLRLRSRVLADILALQAKRPEIKQLYYGRQEGLYFVAPEGWAVYLGDEGDVARKLATLQAVRDKAASEGAPLRVVDLRLEGQAFYR